MKDFVKARLCFPQDTLESTRLMADCFLHTNKYDVFVSIHERTIEVIGLEDEVREFCSHRLLQDVGQIMTFDHVYSPLEVEA